MTYEVERNLIAEIRANESKGTVLKVRLGRHVLEHTKAGATLAELATALEYSKGSLSRFQTVAREYGDALTDEVAETWGDIDSLWAWRPSKSNMPAAEVLASKRLRSDAPSTPRASSAKDEGTTESSSASEVTASTDDQGRPTRTITVPAALYTRLDSLRDSTETIADVLERLANGNVTAHLAKGKTQGNAPTRKATKVQRNSKGADKVVPAGIQ